MTAMGRWAIGALVLAIMGSPACGQRTTDVERLAAVISATEHEARRFTFVEESAIGRLRIEGIVEDDFRYSAELSVDGKAAYREVIDDDILSVRLLVPSALSLLGADAATPEPGIELLTAGRWVTDLSGAPVLDGSGEERRNPGDDPLLDALFLLSGLRDIAHEAGSVQRFDPDSLTYRPDEDPFPAPEGNEIRYDLRPPSLPRPSDKLLTGELASPEAKHFRRIAVYVHDGLVVRVLEHMGVEFEAEELRRRGLVDLPEGDVDDPSYLRRVRAAVNDLRSERGQPPIRFRTVSYELSDHGAPLQISPPADTTIASLQFLQFRGSPTGELPEVPS